MAETFVFHPALVLLAGALLLPWLRGTWRAAVALAVPLLALLLVWRLPDGPAWQVVFLEQPVTLLRGDKLSRLFAGTFAIMAAAGGLYALAQKSRVELAAAYAYAGAAIGAVLAGDLLTLFVWWEVMAIGSTLVLWSAGTEASYRAARRYLMVHLLGGVLLFAGITGHVATTGSVEFTRLALDTPAQWLLLAGFLVNAAAPPLSAWLPDAYPEASWSGTVFLSVFTTKTAVCVLLRAFPGTELLVWLGLAMAFYGIVWGLLENDIRRVLAYAIVNQVGFSLVGVGLGSAMALDGAAAQSVVGCAYVALLLMACGAVMRATGERRGSALGGLARAMPYTAGCAAVGALAISAFPLTSGFVSKSMVMSAAAEGHHLAVWLALVAASAGVVLHAGLKLPWVVFFRPAPPIAGAADPPLAMRVAMALLVLLCLLPGFWPAPLYALLPHGVAYAPYSAAHVLTQLQLLLFAAAAFFVMQRLLLAERTTTLDTDWLWRRLLPALVRVAEGAGTAVGRVARDEGRRLGGGLASAVVRHLGAQARLSRPWSTRSMAMWVLVVLLAYLLLYYVG